MPKKSKINEEDMTAFAEAVKGTTSLQTKSRVPLKQKIDPKMHKPKKDREAFDLREDNYVPPVTGEEYIAFKQVNLSNKILRNLRKAQYNVDATLDLHGVSIEAARVAVSNFLHDCLEEQAQVVLIIHGKGHHGQMPVLKNKLNQWLRQINEVLAFCSAMSSHGSRGAIYVLLKRKLEETDV